MNYSNKSSIFFPAHCSCKLTHPQKSPLLLVNCPLLFKVGPSPSPLFDFSQNWSLPEDTINPVNPVRSSWPSIWSSWPSTDLPDQFDHLPIISLPITNLLITYQLPTYQLPIYQLMKLPTAQLPFIICQLSNTNLLLYKLPTYQSNHYSDYYDDHDTCIWW